MRVDLVCGRSTLMPAFRPLPNYDALDAVFRSDRYAATLGVVLDDWGPGWARVRWTPDEGQTNFGALVHGGALFGLGDVALAVASNSWGRIAVALSVEVQYLAATTAGRVLVADARERSRTRRTGAYLIEVRSAAAPASDIEVRSAAAPASDIEVRATVAPEETLVASLHAVTYRRDAWHLGASAWSDEWRAGH